MKEKTRKCKLGYNDIKVKLIYMENYNLVKVVVAFNDYGTISYKLSTVVGNDKDEIEEGIVTLLKKVEEARGEAYFVSKNFTDPFKEEL